MSESGFVIQNASLLDLESGTLREGTGIRVAGERIVEVSEHPIRHAGVREIDARGRVLMPGLIDAHVHCVITSMNLASMNHKPVTLVAHEAARILEGMLLRGFTTVRDAGGADWGLAEAVDRGLVAGPRIFFSGRVLSQTGGHGDLRSRGEEGCGCQVLTSGFSHVADGVSNVRWAAREELRRGAHQIKIMASGGVASPSDPVWNLQYSPEEMEAIVAEAAGWRTYAMAHAYTPEAIQRAVSAGVRTIEHGNWIDAASARLMVEREAFLVPTLVTYFAIDELGRALGFPAASQAKVKDILDGGLASLEIARDAGVPMGFGTDLLGETHDRQSEEFTIRSQVLTTLEILQSATTVNARILGREDELGCIAEGALADLLLVDGNPLEDLSLLQDHGKHLSLIARGGTIFVDRS